MSTPQITSISHADLTELYKPTGTFLGAGGHGIVIEAIGKDKRPVAVKVCGSPADERDTLLYRTINEALGSTPHLTRVYDVFQATSRSTSDKSLSDSVFCKDDPSRFFNENWYERSSTQTPASYQHRVVVMERLEADMRNCEIGVSSPPIYFQIKFTTWVMQTKHRLVMEDCKSRNIVFKHLTAEDTFRGQKLASYSFWKYGPYYIPRPAILIKLCDYDSWRVKKKPSTASLSDFLVGSIPQEAIERFSVKPDVPDSEILEIF